MPTPRKSDNTGIVPPNDPTVKFTEEQIKQAADVSANDAPKASEMQGPPVEIPREEEWHVTVAGASPVDWERLCMSVGVTPLFIELNDRRLQLMSAIQDKEICDRFMKTLAVHPEFKVLRIKHEVRQLREFEDPLYYEAHVKFDGDYRFDLKGASRDLYRLDPARWYVTWRGLPVLKTITSTVSVFDQNLQRNREDPVETQVIAAPFTTAQVHEQYLNLENATRKLVAIETEWVLIDTNPAIDAGWI